MKTLMLLALPFSLLAGGAAVHGDAAPGKRGPGKMMAKLDADGNGSISKAEAAGTKLETHFAKIDADGNGEVTKAELAKARKGKKGKRGHGKRMAKLDTNGDKMLSAAEVAGTNLADDFAAIDGNADGQITREEMKAHRQARRAERFAKRDTDGNGALSKAEVAGTKLEKRFAKIDADGSGEVTPDELKAAHKAHDGRRGKGDKGEGKKGKKGKKGKSDKGERSAKRGDAGKSFAKPDKADRRGNGKRARG